MQITCHICGEVTFASRKRSITAVVKKAYHLYFGCKIGDQDKSWALHYCCNTCQGQLTQTLGHHIPLLNLISQNELNNLVNDLELSKSKAELWGSRLQQWNLFESNVRISVFRDRQKDLVQFFLMEGDLVYCNGINGLMAALNITYDPNEWRLFINQSKSCSNAQWQCFAICSSYMMVDVQSTAVFSVNRTAEPWIPMMLRKTGH